MKEKKKVTATGEYTKTTIAQLELDLLWEVPGKRESAARGLLAPLVCCCEGLDMMLTREWPTIDSCGNSS